MFIKKDVARGKTLRVNEQIRLPQLRLIDEDGSQLGIVSNSEAQTRAREKGLDLVEISPNARPPVVKIMDYGKYQYHKKKQEKKGRIKARQNELKEVRMRMKTDAHDLEVKKNRVLKFLEKGYKVSVEVNLKGRERMFFEKAEEMLNNFINNLGIEIEFDQPVKRGPNGFDTVIKKKPNSAN